ncbi:MAG TPA: hypothetical protein VGC30_11925 [Dokdonella sp.]
MKSEPVLAVALLVAVAAALPAAHAESLRVHARRAHAADDDAAGTPARGMRMAEVERRFGAPLEKLPAAGGDAPRHPPIHRWRYAGYTVYFERDRVIHSVSDARPTS